MDIIWHGVFYGLILSLGLSALIFLSLYINPEMWWQDAPPEARAQFGPMSDKARRQRAFLSLPFFGFLLGTLALSLINLESAAGRLSYTAVFLNIFTLFMTFNLFDLLIVDWLIIVYWRPQFILLPGVDPDLGGYNSYLFHFHGFLKGTAGILVASLILTAVIAPFI
jgi:hypothetical protein